MSISPLNSTNQIFILSSLNKTTKQQSNQFNQLSSGKKINSGFDDVIGLVKINNLDAAIRGLEQGNQNAATASDVLSTASGGLSSTLNRLQDLRSLAVQAADDNLSTTDRTNITNQANQHVETIDATAQSVNFDGQQLLNGQFADQSFQVGPDAGDTITVSIDSATSNSLGVNSIDLSSSAGATAAIDVIDNAINQVASAITQTGSAQNRLESASQANTTTKINLTQAKSTLEDTDIAEVTAGITASKIKRQAQVNLLETLNQIHATSFSKIIGS